MLQRYLEQFTLKNETCFDTHKKTLMNKNASKLTIIIFIAFLKRKKYVLRFLNLSNQLSILKYNWL